MKCGVGICGICGQVCGDVDCCPCVLQAASALAAFFTVGLMPGLMPGCAFLNAKNVHQDDGQRSCVDGPSFDGATVSGWNNFGHCRRVIDGSLVQF